MSVSSDTPEEHEGGKSALSSSECVSGPLVKAVTEGPSTPFLLAGLDAGAPDGAAAAAVTES